MKVSIIDDEWYPVWSIDKNKDYCLFDVSEDLIKRHDRIMEEFDVLQKELTAIAKGRE